MKTILTLVLCVMASYALADVVNLKSKNTLSIVEVNSGDKINYTLENGRIVEMELLETSTHMVLTSLDTIKEGSDGNGSIFAMTCKIEIDGQVMKMVRYVPVQETFYEPYTVNGLNIWFDATRTVLELFDEHHGPCLPKEKEARFALQDADKPICPETIGNWVDIPSERLVVKDAYSGEDTWLGTYFGADLHGGLDIDMPSNTKLTAPISFDEHYFFNSTSAGHNNNRWRGIRNWDNGDIWYLQTHHLVELIAPEYQSLQKGQPYAYTAGTYSGYAPHTHFVFKVKQNDFDWYYMDPWIIFWQIFENNKKKENAISAYFSPLAPAKTGEQVLFNSNGSQAGIWGNGLDYHWDFGDGYSSPLTNPVHVYAEPGVYPVTLIVDDGHKQDAHRQFITVSGAKVSLPNFRITCKDCPSFKTNNNWKTITYGGSVQRANTLVFEAHHDQYNGPITSQELIITSENVVWREGPRGRHRFDVNYIHGKDWLELEPVYNEKEVKLIVKPQIDKMLPKYGFYEAYIICNHNAINSPQRIRVKVNFSQYRPDTVEVVDDGDVDCIASEFFWLKPEFHFDWAKGYNENYLVNKDNSNGEYVRYIPNLREGTYKIQFEGQPYHNDKLLSKTNGFFVRVKHKDGTEKIWIELSKSLEIGTFNFAKGREGYVEIISDGSKGLVIADAIKFRKL